MSNKVSLELTREQFESLDYALENAEESARQAYAGNADWETSDTLRQERAKFLEHEKRFQELRALLTELHVSAPDEFFR